MLGEYPVLMDDQEWGRLTVTREGLMTVFALSCRDPGELTRFSVYGEREGYLGVAVPDGEGRLYLKKRFSRTELRAMPEQIQYAGRAGQSLVSPAAEQRAPSEGDGTTGADMASQDSPGKERAEEEIPLRALPPETKPAILWRRGAGGALIGSGEGTRFLAVPLKPGIAPVGGDFVRQRIEDGEYAVFEIKSGELR